MSVDLMKNKFDNKAFNAEFEKYKSDKKLQEESENAMKLNEMNTEIKEKKITEMTYSELLSEWQSSITGILNDLIHLRFNVTTFTKDSRPFFFGLTVLIVCVFLFLFYEIIHSDKSGVNRNENVFNISLNLPKNSDSFLKKFMNLVNSPSKQKPPSIDELIL